MPVWPSDYTEKVVKDVEKYNGIRKIVKAGLIERCMTKYVALEKLHPNPADEFSMPEIGPNMEIVSSYTEQVKYDLAHDLPIYKEPVIVQKMEPDGYMLLNGHHKWFAATRMRVKKLHIDIVNLISELDLNRMIQETTNEKLVSFDFDEVLLATDTGKQAPITDAIFSKKYKERLRKGAPEIIKSFQKNGFDVCVYSTNYYTEEDFDNFFSMYGLKVNIVVNGINEKRKNTDGSQLKFKDILRNNYTQIVHVDNESVICLNHITKEYEIHEFDDSIVDWSEGVKKAFSFDVF